MIAFAERGADPELQGSRVSRFSPDGLENKQAHDPAAIAGLYQRSAQPVGLA